ncbi:rhomboid family intramembrane serine protease [Capnocytophaga cynodegmi]|nr:rhomboid family intramembrane serine protease [Capnocytophaga cynodegmi]
MVNYLLQKLQIKRINLAEQVILLNVLLFLITRLLIVFSELSQFQINTWIGLPQSINEFLTKPWTIVTYSFFHANFQHLFWNMLMLFFAGRIFFNLFNNKQFVRVYCTGIIFSGISFLLIEALFPLLFDGSILLGASGAIMALLVFITVIVPKYTVYLLFSIQMKLWAVVSFLILYDIIQISSNPGGKIVHLGGAFTGYFIGILTKKPIYLKSKKIVKLTKNNVCNGNVKPLKSNNDLSESQKLKQHKVNILLDKISASGYTSLTEEEKKFLFEVSKDMNS